MRASVLSGAAALLGAAVVSAKIDGMAPIKLVPLKLEDVLADLAAKGLDPTNTTTSGYTTRPPAAAAAGKSFRPLDGTCTSYETHIEWRAMADSDKDAYVNAVRCLMTKPSAGGFPGSSSRWEDLASVHQQITPDIHMNAVFLPWHRYFLHVHLTMLRNECGYRGPMPWWDEMLDAGNFKNSPVFDTRWFGNMPDKDSNGNDQCVSGGAFQGISLHLGPGGSISWGGRCLHRGLTESTSSGTSRQFVDACNTHPYYDDMRYCQEVGPHASGHNACGGFMGDVAPSPEDPIFYLHHGFVDRNWVGWQNGDIGGRLYQINGNDANGIWTTLDNNLPSGGILPDVKVRDVMDTQGGYLCYWYDH